LIEETRYNPLCDVDEESSSSDMLCEELVIDSEDVINLEIEGETVSEASSNEMLESESESDTSVTCWWVGRHDNGR
jgi:hypothetical protein